MAGLETPPPDRSQNHGFFPDKDEKPMTGPMKIPRMSDEAFGNIRNHVTTDIYSFQRSLIDALDALRNNGGGETDDELAKLRAAFEAFVKRCEGKFTVYEENFSEYKTKFELARIKEETEHFNASARNYNSAMDRHSKALRQLRSTNVNGTYFGGSIQGFPSEVGQINTMKDSQIVEILEALNIHDHHDTDSHKKLHDAHASHPYHHHNQPHNNGVTHCDDTDKTKRSAMLKRQLRVACGLSAFQFATVTINTIEGDGLC